MKKLISLTELIFILLIIFSCSPVKKNNQKSNVIIIHPIVIQSDNGDEPAQMKLSEQLVNRAYSKANIEFHYLEPTYYNNTKARDGEINLDSIVNLSKRDRILKGQNDIINMFFVNAIDGNHGPTGRGMMNGNIVFIALGDKNKTKIEDNKSMEAFVIAHEIGHNLGLKHVVDDNNIIDSLPNIQGDGEFKDRIDPINSLNNYQIKEIYKSPLVHSRISFLEKSQASVAILDETFEPYFSKLQRKEISTFVQEKAPKNIDSARAFARMKFSSAVMDFSSQEKEILTFVVKKTNRWLLENDINLDEKVIGRHSNGSILKMFKILKALVRENNYDVIHVHSGITGSIFILALFPFNMRLLRKTVFTLHNSWNVLKIRNQFLNFIVMLFAQKICTCGISSRNSIPKFIDFFILFSISQSQLI